MSNSIFYLKVGDVLVGVLDRDMRAAGIPIDGLAWLSDTQQVRVDYQDTATSAQMAAGAALVAAHVPVDPLQQVRGGAEQEARDVPNWATWNRSQADAWYQTNVRDPFNAATTLAAMKAVFGTVIQVQWAIIRMVIALRNHTWPGLQD
jgi:hypothetical protein